MRDTFYFSHDYNARTDSKIKRLIAKHGMTGYGIYWAIVEDLYQNANALPTDYESIAFDIRSNKKTIESIVNDFELFQMNGEVFGSNSVQRRLDERSEKSQKAKDSANKRWDKNANALQTQSEGNAIKGKERKVNDIKENEILKEVSVPLSPHPLITWIQTNTPKVQKLKQPLTNDECTKLLEDLKIDTDIKKARLKDMLTNMQNYKPLLTKNESANLTIRNWWKREMERETPTHPLNAIKMNDKPYTR